ncbi:hypothetical protein GCM10010417_21290 [Streptomyces carpaticus]
MELSNMGLPLNSNTATISRRRRAASLTAGSGPCVGSWLMLLSSLGRRILSVLHVSPDVIAKIESTVSDEVGGTSSSLGAKST